MSNGLENALNKIHSSELRLDQHQKREKYQRRDQVTDIYGAQYDAYGTTTNPAVFRFSIGYDLQYYQRFEMKFFIEPFTYADKNGIQPVKSELTDAHLSISADADNDIDVTAAFKKQYPDDWISGQGIFPGSTSVVQTYDVLEALPYLYPWQQDAILSPDVKEIKLSGKGNFKATMVLYLKYSHTNR